MGIFGTPRSLHIWVLQKPFACLVCGHDEFRTRDIKLNSTGMELLDLGWLNESALGVVCTACGYVHEFLNTEAITTAKI